MKRILFVCLGNICRSSSAEEIMRTLVKKAGLEHEIEVDSAGILSYHEGELPDSRMRMHASRRGYDLTHRSRPVKTTYLFKCSACRKHCECTCKYSIACCCKTTCKAHHI